MTRPLVIALGYKARNGKGEFASTIKNNFEGVEVVAFADALREEIRLEAHRLWGELYGEGEMIFPQDGPKAMQMVCEHYGQPFDPDAPIEPNYPWGKQRKLLQYWGTEYRRAQDPDYWLKKVGNYIASSSADAILVDDLRFPNEWKYLGELGAHRIKLTRLGFVSDVPNHVSETSLDGYPFDIELGIPDGNVELLQDMAKTIYQNLLTKHCNQPVD